MRPHSAFTLLELLIVMVLVVAIMALAAPWLKRVWVRSTLKSAAQTLQGELYTTRLDAMKSGEAYLFRYQSQTGVYEILPKKVYDALHSETPDSPYATRSVGTPLDQERLPDEQFSTLAYRKSLPNRFTFGTVKPILNPGETLEIDVTRTVGTDLHSFPSFSEPTQPVWSEPILFFPNGRTSNGSLEILTVGNYRFQIELTLRGLTGTARLGEITIPAY